MNHFKRIIIGGGISGLETAYLSKDYERVLVVEANAKCMLIIYIVLWGNRTLMWFRSDVLHFFIVGGRVLPVKVEMEQIGDVWLDFGGEFVHGEKTVLAGRLRSIGVEMESMFNVETGSGRELYWLPNRGFVPLRGYGHAWCCSCVGCARRRVPPCARSRCRA